MNEFELNMYDGFSGSGIFNEFTNPLKLIGIVTRLRTTTGSYGELCGYIIEPINSILNKKKLHILSIDEEMSSEEIKMGIINPILVNFVDRKSIKTFFKKKYPSFSKGYNPICVIAYKLVSEKCLFVIT